MEKLNSNEGVNRVDFVFVFDVKNGNPNGDPDHGNQPRINSQGYGFVSSECIKRKIRNYVDLKNSLNMYDDNRHNIFIKKENTIVDTKKADLNDMPKKLDNSEKRKYMADKYFDVRTFGQIFSTGPDKEQFGEMIGAVQIQNAVSVEPINIEDMCITRVCKNEKSENKSMGSRSFVEYGLYVCTGSINPNVAEKNGVKADDINDFFETLEKMFINDASSARGLMSSRALYTFTHKDKLGNDQPAHLFELIDIKKKTDEPTCFSDYELPDSVDEEKLNPGITFNRVF